MDQNARVNHWHWPEPKDLKHFDPGIYELDGKRVYVPSQDDVYLFETYFSKDETFLHQGNGLYPKWVRIKGEILVRSSYSATDMQTLEVPSLLRILEHSLKERTISIAVAVRLT